jgi:NADH-quinone oxidoreductase subunit L
MAVVFVSLCIVLPWIGSITVWRCGNDRPGLQHALASVFAVAAGVVSLLMLLGPTEAPVVRIPMGDFFGELTLVPDGLGIILAIIASVVGSLAVVFSIDYMRGDAQLGRYYALILFFIGAMSGLGLSGSMLLMFFFWEITAFCSYALISFHNDDPKAVAGGVKALIVTQFGGIGLLIGALIIRSHTGSYQIRDFLETAPAFESGLLSAIGFGFLLAAMAKSAQFPLHTWLPDAMEAPTPVTALIHAATMVNAGVYLLARFYPAFEDVAGWKTSVMIVGLLSALLAALMATRANDIKRALAYSTISQLGYMIYAIGVGGIFASMFHLLSHAVFKALLFLGAGAVIHAAGTRDMRRMGNLSKKMPVVHAAFIIGGLALAGLPFTNGFFSKELILENGLLRGPQWAFLCMLAGVGLTAWYTLRIYGMTFRGQSDETRLVHAAPRAMQTSLMILAAGALTTWLFAAGFSSLLAESLPYHGIHATSNISLIREIISAPLTYVALLVIIAGGAIWQFRERMAKVFRIPAPVTQFVDSGYGIEIPYTAFVRITQQASRFLRAAHSGQLNLNVAGISAALCILLALLLAGV